MGGDFGAVAFGVTRDHCCWIKNARDLPQTPLDCYSVAMLEEFAGVEFSGLYSAVSSALESAPESAEVVRLREPQIARREMQ